MEAKRTHFDHIRQHVNKVKKYASDLQTFIGVNEMTSVVDGEAKKQKGAFNYDTFFNCTCKFCSTATISSTVCFSILSKWSLNDLRMLDISDKIFLFCNLQVQLKNVLVSMEAKRTDFDNIRQHVNKVKKYASDLQTFIGMNEMTSVVQPF
jgi:exo-beta-1,3-glucanase (GH17 family)